MISKETGANVVGVFFSNWIQVFFISLLFIILFFVTHTHYVFFREEQKSINGGRVGGWMERGWFWAHSIITRAKSRLTLTPSLNLGCKGVRLYVWTFTLVRTAQHILHFTVYAVNNHCGFVRYMCCITSLHLLLLFLCYFFSVSSQSQYANVPPPTCIISLPTLPSSCISLVSPPSHMPSRFPVSILSSRSNAFAATSTAAAASAAPDPHPHTSTQAPYYQLSFAAAISSGVYPVWVGFTAATLFFFSWTIESLVHVAQVNPLFAGDLLMKREMRNV